MVNAGYKKGVAAPELGPVNSVRHPVEFGANASLKHQRSDEHARDGVIGSIAVSKTVGCGSSPYRGTILDYWRVDQR